jgi:hypothetical protein
LAAVRNARHWFESIPDDHPSRLMFGGGARGGGGGDDDSPLIEFHHNTLMSPESMVRGLWLKQGFVCRREGCCCIFCEYFRSVSRIASLSDSQALLPCYRS